MTDYAEGSLFAPRAGLVRRDHPDTSYAAARRVEPRTGTQRAKVLDLIRRRGDFGATDRELQLTLHLPGNSERPRRVELTQAGWLRDSGERREGHIVWVVVR